MEADEERSCLGVAGGKDMLGQRPVTEKGTPAGGWLWGRDGGNVLKGVGRSRVSPASRGAHSHVAFLVSF